jgi:hypothetical protein
MPVTIVDIAPNYVQYPQLRAAVNVTMANEFPFWEGIPIDQAVSDLQTKIGDVLQLSGSQNKPFILGETGWPSAGYIAGVGIAGPDQERQYFEQAFCFMDVQQKWAYYWFTAIDDSWRLLQDPNNTIEPNWGLMYANLTLKPQFVGLEFNCSDNVTYSFAEVDWSIPHITAPPTTLNAASCQAFSACSGLLGNCCPTDTGQYLGCCGSVPSTTGNATAAPNVAPSVTRTPSSVTVPTTGPPQQVTTKMPTLLPSTKAPLVQPTAKRTPRDSARGNGSSAVPMDGNTTGTPPPFSNITSKSTGTSSGSRMYGMPSVFGKTTVALTLLLLSLLLYL